MKTKVQRWESGGCLPTPLVSIWITGACNLRCKHCYESHNSDQRRHLPVEKVKLIMDRLAPHVNSISFMGGEPTLHPDLPEICAHAQELGKYTLLVSNGATITRELISKLEGKVDCVKLGMDGVTAEKHDLVRGKGSFAKAMGAWEILAPRIPTMCKFTLNNQNLVELPLISKFYQELGAKRLVLNGWLKLGTGASIWSRKFALSAEQRRQINDFVFQELKPNYHIFPISRSCSLDHGCRDFPARTFYVDSQAAVSPCIFSGHLGLGNMLAPEVDVWRLLTQVNRLRTLYDNLHEARLVPEKKAFPLVLPELQPQVCPH